MLKVTLILLLACSGAVGCVRRTVSITSEPSGALVLVNDREIGRTPCSFDFTFYGTYDVQLRLTGFEPLSTHAEAVAPLWDTIPVDAVSEAMPTDLRSTNEWHFTLVPLVADRAALIDRAHALRRQTAPADADPAPAPDPR